MKPQQTAPAGHEVAATRAMLTKRRLFLVWNENIQTTERSQQQSFAPLLREGEKAKSRMKSRNDLDTSLQPLCSTARRLWNLCDNSPLSGASAMAEDLGEAAKSGNVAKVKALLKKCPGARSLIASSRYVLVDTRICSYMHELRSSNCRTSTDAALHRTFQVKISNPPRPTALCAMRTDSCQLRARRFRMPAWGLLLHSRQPPILACRHECKQHTRRE